jgi:ABC-type sugar transport system permease subunit
MVVSLAAIRSVPRDILDASSIDGADYFRRVFFVIIPLLRNIILTMALLQAVRFFQEMTMPFILTEGGPGNATMVLSMYTYKLAFTYWDFGLASTVGTVWLVFLVIFGFIYVRLFFKKID